MTKYHRIAINRDGTIYIVDDDGNRLSPAQSRRIGQGIIDTANAPIFVYLAKRKSKSGQWEYKIGMSNDPERRERELSSTDFGTFIDYHFRCEAWGENSARELEKALHVFYKYAGLHISGEWFRLNEQDVQLFKKWFGDGIKLTPGKAMFDTVRDIAECCRVLLNVSQGTWENGLIIAVFNSWMASEHYDYHHCVAITYGYRRLTELYAKHYNSEDRQGHKNAGEIGLNDLIEDKTGYWMHEHNPFDFPQFRALKIHG
jgi:hypothetical protein